ncbi:MAG: hypothetical protein KDI76_14100 [Xanthomonadales bacterium]|nr:hypothetical protein [Xanthomonadales bacterium]
MTPLAESGNGDANYYLGLIHDPEFNFRTFSKERTAINKKMLMTASPTYYEENEKKVIHFYESAIKLGNKYASFQLGRYFDSASFKRQKTKKHKKLFRDSRNGLKALAENGDWLAKYMLGVIYSDKGNFKIYTDEALKAMNEAAKKGDRMAQFYLGKSMGDWYCRSDTCRNKILSFAWLSTSAFNGSYHAKWFLSGLIEVMSEEELEQAKTLAIDYINKYGRK